MAIEHVDAVDPEIHEPKDISSATSGTVYTADGVGSGAWSASPNTLPSNKVIVNDLADLPTPIADVITLADNTLYEIGPVINLTSNRIVLGNNSILEGVNRRLSAFLSTTSGSLITATGVECRISCLTLGAAAATKLVDFDGGGVFTLRLEDVLSVIHTGIAVECTDALSCILINTLFIGGTDALVCTGTNNTNMLLDTIGFADFSGKGIDLGTSVWDDCSLSTSFFSGDSGSFSLSGLVSSGNITAGNRFIIANNSFNGLGTPLQNIDSQDIRYLFISNSNIPDSKVAAQMFLTGSALTTTLVAATPTKINATTWIAAVEDRFTVDASGTLTYIGEEDVEVEVSATVTGSGVSGSNEYNFYIAKNSTELVASKTRQTCPSTSDTSVHFFSIVSLSTNDTLEAFVEQAGGTDFDAKDANMVVIT